MATGEPWSRRPKLKLQTFLCKWNKPSWVLGQQTRHRQMQLSSVGRIFLIFFFSKFSRNENKDAQSDQTFCLVWNMKPVYSHWSSAYKIRQTDVIKSCALLCGHQLLFQLSVFSVTRNSLALLLDWLEEISEKSFNYIIWNERSMRRRLQFYATCFLDVFVSPSWFFLFMHCHQMKCDVKM